MWSSSNVLYTLNLSHDLNTLLLFIFLSAWASFFPARMLLLPSAEGVFFISVSIFSNQNVSSLTLLYQEHTHTHCHRFCLRNSPFANFTLSAAHISISVTQSSINPVLGSHTPLSTLHIQVPTRSSLPAAPPPRTVYTEHKRRRRHDMFCHELHSD